MPMAASSLRPIRRASTSSFPAAVSNRQPFALFTRGTGNGQPSLPTMSTFRSVALVDQAPPFGDGDGEHLAVLAAGRLVGRRDQLLALGAKDGQQLVHVPGFDRLGQRAHRFFGRGERSLGGALCRDDQRLRRSATHISATPTSDRRPQSLASSASSSAASASPRRRLRASCSGCSVLANWPRASTRPLE